jgi:antitoxin (DNA-binding transcriptional repressor) of toxin-antitoxin stability system
MQSINIHEAKTHLSRLVDLAAQGESFVIAKAGKQMVKVVALPVNANGVNKRSLGFMRGQFTVPKDFDSMGAQQIEQMFGLAGTPL